MDVIRSYGESWLEFGGGRLDESGGVGGAGMWLWKPDAYVTESIIW